MTDKKIGIFSFTYDYAGAKNVGIDANGLLNQLEELERDAIKVTAGYPNYKEMYEAITKIIADIIDRKQKK